MNRNGNVEHGPVERPARDTDLLERRIVLLEVESKDLRSEVVRLREKVARLEALDGLHELGEAAVA